MKFLIALSVLASSSVFANDFSTGDYIKCYEPAQQGQEAELAYKLKEKQGYLYVIHPFKAQLQLNQDSCLETVSQTPGVAGDHLEFCLGEGQRINGYVPVEVRNTVQEEETVYCEKEIKDWFEI